MTMQDGTSPDHDQQFAPSEAWDAIAAGYDEFVRPRGGTVRTRRASARRSAGRRAVPRRRRGFGRAVAAGRPARRHGDGHRLVAGDDRAV